MKIKNILISQPKPNELEKSPYADLIKKFGVDIDYHKFIKIEGVPARDFRKTRIHLEDYTAVIFTSRNSVDHFFRISKEMRFEVPDTMKYFCLSDAIAFYLQKYVQYRKRKIFHGNQEFEELVEIIKKHHDEKYLLPCSNIHKQDLSKLLDKCKVNFTKAVIYKTMANDLSAIDIKKYDVIVFFSPAGVKSLYKNFPDFEQNSTCIGAFGPSTAKAVADAGLTLNITAPTKTAPSMSMALEEFVDKTARAK